MTASSPAWRRYLRFWGRDPDADLDDELRFHIESRMQEYLAAGMDPAAARSLAMQRFGDVADVRARCEAIDRPIEQHRRRADMLETLLQDLRFAGRALRRNPGFTLVAVVTLALGIGANTAIFSVVNGVLLRPLPFAQPDRLVQLFTSYKSDPRYSMSQPEYMDYKRLTQVFEDAGAYAGTSLTLTGDREPERVRALRVTRDLLPTLGIVPLRGRNFQGDEGRQGTEPVVILSHDFWQNRLGGAPDVVGRTLTFNGAPRRVVGILPPGRTVERAEAMIPHFINPDSLANRGSAYLTGVARLKPGVTLEQAQRELNALTARVNVEHKAAYDGMGYGALAVPLHEVAVGDVRRPLLVLLGAVGLVLLIACANVANLLLARGEARQREVAVRLALGASRRRLVRQLLTESTLLALVGGAVGLVMAQWGLRALLAVNPDAIPRMQEIRLDATVGLVTAGVALLTGLLFGLAPALQLVRGDLNGSLKDGARGGSEGAQRQRLGRTLVAAEIALAVVVVVGAALLVRSFWALSHTDGGFRPDGVLAVDMSIPATRYDPKAAADFYRQLVERAGALPGVQVASAANDIPPVSGRFNWDIDIAGRPRAPGQASFSPNIRAVTRDYFRTLTIPAARGRLFTAEDHATSMPVMVLNETGARTIFPDGDAIGQRVRFGSELPWITIVGVVRDVRTMGLGAPVPVEAYLVHEQMPTAAGGAERAMYVLLRTAGDPASLAAPMRQAIREMDPLLAVTAIRTMPEIMERSIAGPRFTMLLLGVFGAVALALAAIGIYGIMAYAVRRRTREIGIRIALGAEPSAVLGLVVGNGMRLALLGLAIGLAGAWAATRLMENLLFGVSRTDPLTYGAIALLLAGVAFVASWVPARRAVATDPTAALRAE